jgi:predicted dehydrogenase
MMSNTSAFRAGIVGCGYQGGILAKAAGKTTSFKVVACADPNREAAAKLAAEYGGLRSFDSIELLLAGSDVDVIFVATPHHLLAPATLTAIQAGKHVLVEKPVGLIEAEAIQIEKAAAKD